MDLFDWHSELADVMNKMDRLKVSACTYQAGNMAHPIVALLSGLDKVFGDCSR